MQTAPKHFTIVDPRSLDGDPFEVADRAVGQLVGLVNMAREAMDAAKLMARNAELERQCQRDEPLDAEGWPDTAEGRRWTKVDADLEATEKDLRVLRQAAAFNPRRPPKMIG